MTRRPPGSLESEVRFKSVPECFSCGAAQEAFARTLASNGMTTSYLPLTNSRPARNNPNVDLVR